MKRRMTVREVARALSVCEETVRRLRRRGQLRGSAIGGRWRFDPADVQAYLDAHASTGAAA